MSSLSSPRSLVGLHKTIGVMGSGATSYLDLALPLGRLLAGFGVNLLTGGGRGTMAAVSRSFCEVEGRRGRAIGVLPGEQSSAGVEPPPGYPNPWVEIVIRTHLGARGDEGAGPASRNHINILSSDGIVFLPEVQVRAVSSGSRCVIDGLLSLFSGLPAGLPEAESISGSRSQKISRK